MIDYEKVVFHAQSVSKVYPGTKALDDVSFDVLRGKVNVLIGENGAGKSTLMKLIAGIEQPSSGKLYMDGQEISLRDTNDARAHGIGIIHQELSLFPNLAVYQNIFMAHEKTKTGLLNDQQHIAETERVLARLEHPINPHTLVSDLRVGHQQMIEIARNLVADDLKILIMDEPTSSLSEQEVEVLFKIMRELTASGISIVYISHRLEEIMRIGDHVTVLQDGRYVADAEIATIDLPWIVRNMVGSDKSYQRHERVLKLEEQPVILEVKDLCLPKQGGGWLLNKVNFKVRKGEVFGIYGLLGAGRTEIFECLIGSRPEHTGVIWLEGEQMKISSIANQIDRGFALVPEDRQREGLVQTLNIEKNISLSALKNYRKGPFVDTRKENKNVDAQIRDIRIKVADKHLPILSLSGGNQQKAVIGKGLLTDPKILLLDEPSRGIDIGAKTEVFDIIHQYAERGLTILVVSSELKEILAIADRVMVLSNGVCTAEYAGDDITENNLVLASYAGHHVGAKETEGEYSYEEK